MNYLVILGQVLLYSVLLGLFFWGMKSAISFYVFARRKEEINKLHARISVLKMHLKGKIKRKCNKIETAFKKDSEILKVLAPKLNLICALSFSSSTDYQTFISNLHMITEEIIAHIKIKNKNAIKPQDEDEIALSETDKVNDKCKKLLKYDKAHMMIIIEIIQATEELKEKIVEFNELVEYEKNQKKIEVIPEKIEIEHYGQLSQMMENAGSSDTETSDIPALENEHYAKSA